MEKPSLDACLFQVVDIKQIAQRADKEQSLTTAMLMGRAAQSALDSIVHHYPRAQQLAVFCGKGDNGADGLYLAAIAKAAGADVHCVWLRPAKLNDKQVRALAKAEEVGVEFVSATNAIDDETDLIIDALIGLGYQGELSSDLLELVSMMQEAKKPIVCIGSSHWIKCKYGCCTTGYIS